MRRATPPKGLREYEAKRDFEVTPEPAPGATTATRARQSEVRPSFMVHKHDATRLHYDLRLEIAGALASWSIPKGPSFDPVVKRLAVQTEDHPLAYGEFEGRIPEGEYGAGDSIIWDRGTYETVPPGEAARMREKGHIAFELFGQKLKGRWHLVRTRPDPRTKPQWLFFKGKDAEADPGFDVVEARPESVVSGRVLTRGPERASVLRATHPAPDKLLAGLFPPMLATLVSAPPPHDETWLYEVKYDGFRALTALSGGKLAMWTRNALDLTKRFPAVARALQRVVVGEAVIDGEIVAIDEEGASRFQLLQQGRGEVLFAFDLLWLDGHDLRQMPLERRRDLLESLLANAPAEIRIAERVAGPGAEALASAAKRGFEGVIGKVRGSSYEPGRSRVWLKLKAVNTQELAIVGFTPSKANTRDIGALLLGVMEGKELTFAGKVGTGFSSKVRTELRRELVRDAVPAPSVTGAPRMRDATWVEPRLVCQVQFTEWTSDGKLRHPSFQGLRPDKTPAECVRERPARPHRSSTSPGREVRRG